MIIKFLIYPVYFSKDLDNKIEVLEENGGSGGNVTALEERVATLEVTANAHEERLITAEADTLFLSKLFIRL